MNNINNNNNHDNTSISSTEIMMIELFKLFQFSHPNISLMWISHLELKKRHYTKNDEEQCIRVLCELAFGREDFKVADIARLILYEISII